MDRACLVVSILLIAGCASGEWVYDKPNVTANQVDHDLATCRKESSRNTGIAITPSQRIDRDAFNRCMLRKGYTVRLEK